MGFVMQPIGRVPIRTDTYQVISDKQEKELKQRGLSERRSGFDIFIYPEANGEFDYFYGRHVGRSIKNGAASVIVADEVHVTNRARARQVLEKAIMEAAPKIIEGRQVVFVPIPQAIPGFTLSVRNWDYDLEQFTSRPADCCFVLRDIVDVTSAKKFISIRDRLSANEFERILRLINVSRAPGETYIIRFVFYIGKYFPAASD